MNFIRIVIIGFVILETSNVLALYFFPDSKYANSVGIFKAWQKSKDDSETHNFEKYLVNWVAGSKLIFILLLIVILLKGDAQILTMTAAALAVATASFFWRLFPLIRAMDRAGQIDPQNYSRILSWMILALIGIFLAAIPISIW